MDIPAILQEIRDEIAHLLADVLGVDLTPSPPPETTIIRVAKPWCTPARDAVYNALQTYGIHILSYSEDVVTVDGERKTYNQALRDRDGAFIEAQVEVRTTQAEWAEYLLLRTRKFRLMSTPINPKNAAWAAKHNGMPVPWTKSGKLRRWKERNCDGSSPTCKRKRPSLW